LITNEDKRKQIQVRSRYLLYKTAHNWTKNQCQRSKILFNEYPNIKIDFDLVHGLRNIFNTATSIQVAYT
jgi:hypothetical protein